MQKLVKTGKNTEINKQSDVKLIEENMELPHIHLVVLSSFIYFWTFLPAVCLIENIVYSAV